MRLYDIKNKKLKPGKKILIAMSGGVDSSVGALLLRAHSKITSRFHCC